MFEIHCFNCGKESKFKTKKIMVCAFCYSEDVIEKKDLSYTPNPKTKNKAGD